MDAGGLPVAGHLEQVRAHRVDPVMPGERGVRGRSGFGRGQLPQTRRRAVHRDRDLAVTAGGDVAFCHSLNRLSATPHDAPQKFDLWFRATVGLRKIDGSWQITHEQELDALLHGRVLRAALDLTP